VVLLDLDMPGRSPFGAVAELSRTCPDTRVIVCSGHISGELVRLALDSGCWGYVTKNENTGILVDAVRKVAAGGVYLGPEVKALSEAEE
jgi:DNA-binding NarL/FixJ family response regulator